MSKEKILEEFDKKLLKVCDVYEKAADNTSEKLENWEKEREEIKQFISDLIDQTREETIKEIESKLPLFIEICNDKKENYTEWLERTTRNQTLKKIRDILNKLKK